LSPDQENQKFWRELRRWRGVLLMGVISVGTVWLAVTNQLVLYIHPRYVVFTVIMALVALVFTVARVIVSSRSTEHDHEDDDEDQDARPLQRALSITALTLAAALAAGAVLLPPATLSAATASQRDITATQTNLDAASLEEASSADGPTFSRYTVLEWSSLLAQTSDPVFYAGKPVDVVGFITPDPVAADVFYVSRFSITCCAVDAQPVGVPVYLPDWSSQFAADDWVQVTGEFASNRSTESTAPIALAPAGVIGVEQPSDPYLF
jgi:putative membrane protein